MIFKIKNKFKNYKNLSIQAAMSLKVIDKEEETTILVIQLVKNSINLKRYQDNYKNIFYTIK